jgi:uncharacterized membrane protein YfcA
LIYINTIIFFLIALIYSAAGFGGGSLYLAVLSESGWPPEKLVFIALSCNFLVTLIGAIRFHLNHVIPYKRLWAVLVLSVPFSYWASTWKVTDQYFFITLASALMLAAIAMIAQSLIKKNEGETKNAIWIYAIVPFMGLLAGMTGIGGGIYLSPLLHLSNWGKPREIAAVACVFILINSLAGLIARWSQFSESPFSAELALLPAAVVVGGYIGSKLSAKILSQQWIRWITIVILIFAAIRIFIRFL